jgi:hypothetical protein
MLLKRPDSPKHELESPKMLAALLASGWLFAATSSQAVAPESSTVDKLPAPVKDSLAYPQPSPIKESFSSRKTESSASAVKTSVSPVAGKAVLDAAEKEPTGQNGADTEVASNTASTSGTGGGTAGSETEVDSEGTRTAATVKPKADSASLQAKYKQGLELNLSTDTEDLVPTDDVALARKQVASYPDSPEASFILAVAMTRTSHVEEALQEVKRAKKLAEAKGGPSYFDKMITTYEEMLKNYPKENRVRYGLAWAYYMKAYLLAQHSAKIQKWNAAQAQLQAAAKSAAAGGESAAPAPSAPAAKPNNIWDLAQVAGAAAASGDASKQPHIQGALEKAEPTMRPQIKKYYEAALTKLDDLLAQKPDDIWAKVYRAFLKAEYTGDLEPAMAVWKQCRDQSPNNPAPYFFLGEGYLKQGNLKECFNNVSKAIALRSLGN